MKQDNFAVEPLVLIQQKTVPDDATVVVIAGPTTDFFPPEIEALNAYVAKGGKVMVMLDPLLKGPAQPLLAQFLADWGIRAGTDVVLDASGMGQMLGTDASVPVAAAVSAASDHRGLPRDHGLSDGAIDDADRRRLERAHRTAARDHQPAELVGSRHRVALDRQGRSRIQRRQGRQAGADHAGCRGVGARHGDAAAAVGQRHARRRRMRERKPETRVVAVGDSDFAVEHGDRHRRAIATSS